jgi:hypothetical protein
MGDAYRGDTYRWHSRGDGTYDRFLDLVPMLGDNTAVGMPGDLAPIDRPRAPRPPLFMRLSGIDPPAIPLRAWVSSTRYQTFTSPVVRLVGSSAMPCDRHIDPDCNVALLLSSTHDSQLKTAYHHPRTSGDGWRRHASSWNRARQRRRMWKWLSTL